MHRPSLVPACLLSIALLWTCTFALAQPPAEPVRLELTPRAELPAGTTTLVSHDVSQWVCLQRMPSSVVVPVNVRLSDRAEATREPASADVTDWFELAGHAGADGVDIVLERVDQIWDVTPVGAGGIAFRIFCRVVLAMTPTDDDGSSDAAERSFTIVVTIRNLGGHSFARNYPVRVVPGR